MLPVALTIAGSDPSAGAGLQADLRTFHRRGVYGAAVVTLVTVQNAGRFEASQLLRPALVAAQLEAVLEELPVAAAKTGALGSAETVWALARRLGRTTFPLVIDPVMSASRGGLLLDERARSALVAELLPRALVVTPNLAEAAILAGMPVADVSAMEEAARRIAALGPQAVVVKGGHLRGAAVDVLLWKDEIRRFASPRTDARPRHGAGCTYSAAITAELAKGRSLDQAVDIAKRFITSAIAGSDVRLLQ